MGKPSKYIFQHIHKCGGTSISKTFRDHPNFTFSIPREGTFEHGTATNQIDKGAWESAKKFTIVRNPYDRAVSAYKMFCKPTSLVPNKWRKIFPDFLEFARFLNNADLTNHCAPPDVPTKEYIKSIDNVIHHCSTFSNPKYRIDEMDEILRIESLEEDFEKAFKDTSLIDYDLQHANKTFAKPYREFYCEESRILIAQAYKEDIERFCYEF